MYARPNLQAHVIQWRCITWTTAGRRRHYRQTETNCSHPALSSFTDSFPVNRITLGTPHSYSLRSGAMNHSESAHRARFSHPKSVSHRKINFKLFTFTRSWLSLPTAILPLFNRKNSGALQQKNNKPPYTHSLIIQLDGNANEISRDAHGHPY